MTEAPATTEAPWIGWQKRYRHRWEAVVGGATFDEALRALMDLPRENGDWSLIVLKRGEKP